MKKLAFLIKTSFILLGTLFLFNSCTDDKHYYYEDPSASWDILTFEVDRNGGGNRGRWNWDEENKRYYSIFNINSDDVDIDKFIYNNGATIGYVYLGYEGNDEVQNPLPFYHKENGAYLNYDFAIQGSNEDFTVCYYFQWHDGRQQEPPFYKFRLVLIW